MAEKKAKVKSEAKGPQKTEVKSEARRPQKTEVKSEARRPQKRARADDNVVYVGQKPTMSYVLAVITQFSSGIKEVHVKARGRSISRAVDVAEVVRNKFMTDLKVKNVEIGTEKREVEDGNKINVSTMSIVLAK